MAYVQHLHGKTKMWTYVLDWIIWGGKKFKWTISEKKWKFYNWVTFDFFPRRQYVEDQILNERIWKEPSGFLKALEPQYMHQI